MTADLKILRFKFSPQSTISELYFNNTLFGYTLEDVDRELHSEMSLEEIKSIKEYGSTAIPYGSYEASLYESPKHGMVPLLHNVKGFDKIEMHKGNFPKDTLGCLLVGTSFGEDRINNSRVGFLRLMDELVKYDKINVTISKKSN